MRKSVGNMEKEFKEFKEYKERSQEPGGKGPSAR
jgi:hypothetical protein